MVDELFTAKNSSQAKTGNNYNRILANSRITGEDHEKAGLWELSGSVANKKQKSDICNVFSSTGICPKYGLPLQDNYSFYFH